MNLSLFKPSYVTSYLNLPCGQNAAIDNQTEG